MQLKQIGIFKLSAFVVVIALLGQSCKEPALMFRPIVINRDALDGIFADGSVTKIVFQNENQADDRKHRKRHIYRLNAFKQSSGQYIPIDAGTLFGDARGLKPVPIKIDKEGLTTDFSNYYLKSGFIPKDTLVTKRLLLLYPSLLGTTGLDAKYIKYDITFADLSEVPSVIEAQVIKNKSRLTKGTTEASSSGDLRARLLRELALNPSPPRNEEGN